jgi:Ulp1 family protease
MEKINNDSSTTNNKKIKINIETEEKLIDDSNKTNSKLINEISTESINNIDININTNYISIEELSKKLTTVSTENLIADSNKTNSKSINEISTEPIENTDKKLKIIKNKKLINAKTSKPKETFVKITNDQNINFNFYDIFGLKDSEFDKPWCIDTLNKYKKIIETDRDFDVLSLLSMRELLTLKPNTWLVGHILELFFQYLQKEEEKKPKEQQKNFFSHFDLLNLRFTEDVTDFDLFSQGVRLLGKHQKSILDYEKIIFPTNLNSTHFVLITVHMKDENIFTYDSLIQDDNKAVKNAMTFYANFINHIRLINGFGLSNFKHTILSTTPQQNNCNDCGVFTCMFGNDIHEFNKVDVNNSTQAKISYFRLFILFTFFKLDEHQLNEKYEQMIKNENNYKNSPIIILDEAESANTTVENINDNSNNNNNNRLITANKPIDG